MWFRTTSMGFILIFFFIVLLGTSPTNAQNPDKNDKEAKALINRLQNQLKEAERDLQKAQVIINNLKQDLQQSQTKIKSLQVELQKEKKDNPKEIAISKELDALKKEFDALKKGGYVHVATYKLKAEAPSTAIRSFIDDAQLQLLKIRGVRWLWIGERDENSASGSKEYHVAMTVIFDDLRGLKGFQDDPIQKQFWKKHEKNWEASLSYDFLPKR